MPGQMLWIWDTTNKKWVKLAGTAAGAMSIHAIVEALSDIRDVTVVGIADGMGIYWDNATSTWKVKQFLPLAGGTLTGNLVMDEGGLKIILANDAAIQLGTLDGSPLLFGGNAASPYEAWIKPKDGNRIGELGIMPSGTEDYSALVLWNSSDYDNGGFIRFSLNGEICTLFPDEHGAGVTPTLFRITLNTEPSTDNTKRLGSSTVRWSDIFALLHHICSAVTGSHPVSGTIVDDLTAGEDVVLGDAVVMRNDSKVWKSDADTAAAMPVMALAAETIDADAQGDFLTQGFMYKAAWDWTPGGIIYASITSGELSQTAPVGSGHLVQVVGVAKTADIIYFNPSFELVEIS